jgi:hypothetical protein
MDIFQGVAEAGLRARPDVGHSVLQWGPKNGKKHFELLRPRLVAELPEHASEGGIAHLALTCDQGQDRSNGCLRSFVRRVSLLPPDSLMPVSAPG